MTSGLIHNLSPQLCHVSRFAMGGYADEKCGRAKSVVVDGSIEGRHNNRHNKNAGSSRQRLCVSQEKLQSH